jgi:UDP-glucose 4-epimerase
VETSVLRLVELLGEHAGEAGFEPEFRDPRLGEIDRSCLAVGRARETIGWTAQVGIDDGLRRTYEWASSV